MRRLARQAVGQIGIAHHFHAIGGGEHLAWHGVFTVATAHCRQVHNHRAWLHAVHHRFGNQFGRRLAWNRGGGDDDVHLTRLLGKQFHFCGNEFFRHHFGIAIAAASRLLWEVQFQELAAHGFDLLGHFQARVKCLNHRTQRISRTNSCQTCHTRTNHQHLRRRHFARSGDLARKETAKIMRRFNHGAIATDVGHRRQSIHGLGTRNARHHFHRQRGDVLCAQSLNQLRLLCGLYEADQSGARIHLRHFGFSRWIQFEYQRVFPSRIGRNNAGPCIHIGLVIKIGTAASATFYRHGKAQFEQLRHCCRRCCNAQFTERTFLRNADLHRVPLSLMVWMMCASPD